MESFTVQGIEQLDLIYCLGVQVPKETTSILGKLIKLIIYFLFKAKASFNLFRRELFGEVL